MKKLRVQIVLVLCFAANSLPMHGMFARFKNWYQASTRPRAMISRQQSPTMAQTPRVSLMQQNRSYRSSATSMATAAARSWSSYIPGSASNKTETLYQEMLKKVSMGSLLTTSEINAYAEQALSSNYSIVNRTDSNGNTLLFYTIVYFFTEGHSSYKDRIKVIDNLRSIGAVLNDKDKEVLSQGPEIIINRWKSLLAGRDLTFKNMTIDTLKEISDLCNCLYGLGVDISKNIHVNKLFAFEKSLESAEKFQYNHLGQMQVVISFIGGNFVHDRSVEGYTIKNIEDMVTSKKIPFMENDINVIMQELSKKNSWSSSDTIITFSQNNSRFNVDLPVSQLKEAARNGNLRMSLIEKFRLQDLRKKYAPMYKVGSNKKLDIIYDLLLESNLIEVKQKLNAYEQLCAAASFMKGLSGQTNDFDFKGSATDNQEVKVANDLRIELKRHGVSLSDRPTEGDVGAGWRKAVQKIHPDLTTDPDEKKVRTKMVQRLNELYNEYLAKKQSQGE